MATDVKKFHKFDVEEKDSDNIRKMKSLLGRWMKILLTDGREFIGVFTAFDDLGNILLRESVERRVVKINDTVKESDRLMASVIIPAKYVVKCCIEDKEFKSEESKK